MPCWPDAGAPAVELEACAVSGPKRNPALPVVRTWLAELGSVVGSGASPEELAASLKRDSDKQGATLRGLGIKPQDLGG